LYATRSVTFYVLTGEILAEKRIGPVQAASETARSL